MDRNPFGELLRLMSTEDLQYWRDHSTNAGNTWLSDIFDDELQERAMPTEYPKQ